MILLILLITMFSESILGPTLLLLYTVQCKTHVTCKFPSYLSYSRSYIMWKLQIKVYCNKHIYSLSN